MTGPGDFCGFDRSNGKDASAYVSGVRRPDGTFEVLDILHDEQAEVERRRQSLQEQPPRGSWLSRFVRNIVGFRWGVRL